MTKLKFFLTRCAGETDSQYRQRAIDTINLRRGDSDLENAEIRPIAGGKGYFDTDGALLGYVR